MRALITGSTGQDGPYLIRELQEHGYEVFAVYRGQDEVRMQRFRDEYPGVTWVRGDVTDPSSMHCAVRESRPDVVFNLAALSYVGLSWPMAALYMETNAGGLLNVLEAVRNGAPEAHVVQASTSEMYGNSGPSRSSLAEDSPMHPASPYGVAKLAAHNLCRVYRDSYGMRVTSAISFNHESPRRPVTFVTRKVTQAAVRIAEGRRTSLELGNLDVWRDWGYAPDFMRAYRLLAECEESGDYVVGTGEAHSLSELCAIAFAEVGMNWREHVRSVKSDRPNDLTWLQACPLKLQAMTGWRPSVSFAEMIADMVAADRDGVPV